MAENTLATYGRDLRCIRDADELWSEAEGVDVIRQDVIHLITCEDFLGPEGDRRGIDLRKMVGKTTDEMTRYGAIVSQIIQDADPRVETADVVLEAVKNAKGNWDVNVDIQCTTALGPFEIVGLIGDIFQTGGSQ